MKLSSITGLVSGVLGTTVMFKGISRTKQTAEIKKLILDVNKLIISEGLHPQSHNTLSNVDKKQVINKIAETLISNHIGTSFIIKEEDQNKIPGIPGAKTKKAVFTAKQQSDMLKTQISTLLEKILEGDVNNEHNKTNYTLIDLNKINKKMEKTPGTQKAMHLLLEPPIKTIQSVEPIDKLSSCFSKVFEKISEENKSFWPSLESHGVSSDAITAVGATITMMGGVMGFIIEY